MPEVSQVSKFARFSIETPIHLSREKGSKEFLEVPFEFLDKLSPIPTCSGTLAVYDGAAELLNINLDFGFKSRGHSFSALIDTDTLPLGRYSCVLNLLIGEEIAIREFTLGVE